MSRFIEFNPLEKGWNKRQNTMNPFISSPSLLTMGAASSAAFLFELSLARLTELLSWFALRGAAMAAAVRVRMEAMLENFILLVWVCFF